MFQPVFECQSRHEGKLALIVCDRRGVDRQRLRGNPCIVGPNWRSLKLQKCSNLRIMSRCVVVDSDKREPLSQRGQASAVAVAISAVLGAEF